MKKIIHYFLIIVTVAVSHQPLNAQVDPHFSQYYLQPMMLNPALTGAIEGDYRVSGIWRSQYNNTLSTKGVSGEVVTDKNCNIGVNILNQSTSDKAYNFTNAYLTMAYTGVRFGPGANHYLVLSFQCGYMNRLFNVSKLQFGDQWNSGLGYDPSMNSGEVFNKPSISTFDAGTGIAYYDATPNKKLSLFGGISAFHITRPAYPFLSDGDQQRLPVRYCVQAGARIIASDLISIVPSAIYMREGDAEEKMIGTYLQLYASENTDFMFGAYYRVHDAITPFAGIYYKGLTVGISYDVNASYKTAGATMGNSLELSISFVGQKKNSVRTNTFYCPRF